MAQVRVPVNCQGMTLTTSGAVVATSNIITCTAAEATALCAIKRFPGSQPVRTTDATGLTSLLFPEVITNITINSVGYAVNPIAGSLNSVYGTTATIPAADATVFLASCMQIPGTFQLVSG